MRIQPKDVVALYTVLAKAFTLADLIELMRDDPLNVEPHDWEGDKPDASGKELATSAVTWCNRVGRVYDLLIGMRTKRPQNSDVSEITERLLIVLLGQGVDVAVRFAPAGSRATVEEVQRRAIRLQDLKAMHELLHRIRNPLFEIIPVVARLLENEEMSPGTARWQVREQVKELRRVVEQMRTEASKATWDGQDLQWIDTLSGAIDVLEIESANPAAPPNPKVLRQPDPKVGPTLRTKFALINKKIVAQADELSLAGLGEFLSSTRKLMAGALDKTEDGLALDSAVASVNQVQSDLRRHVSLHDHWQEIHEELRRLEVSRELDGELRRLHDWLGEQCHQVSQGATAQWVNDFTRFCTALWAAVEEPIPIVAVGASTSSDSTSQTSDQPNSVDARAEELAKAFNDFRASADTGFFIVDENLKRHCDQLVGVIKKLKDLPQ